MLFDIKELRESTGMTQKAFAASYGIPLSTLRKWEQGEAKPAPYILKLIARTLPRAEDSLQKISAKDGKAFYYDKSLRIVLDMQGNQIRISEDLDGVKEQNLVLYLTDLFEEFYRARDKFERDCKYDKEEDILWTQ